MRRTCSSRRCAFSLIELLIVIAVMSIVAAMVTVNSNSGIHDQLQSAAEVVAAEVMHARSLAVTHGSSYRWTFNTTAQTMTLEHTGSNSALNNLPRDVFRSSHDTATQHLVTFSELPTLGTRARVLGVQTAAGTPQSVTTLEFGALGETTRSDNTVIWLACGQGASARYMSITVNAVTGLTSIGDFQAAAPPGIATAPTGATAAPAEAPSMGS